MTTTHGDPQASQMRLYSAQNRRLYINASERDRFIAAANRQTPHIRAFCLTLLFTGCRLSEARALTIHSVQTNERLLSIRSLKKRSIHHIREIPIPDLLINLHAAQTRNTLNRDCDLLWQTETGGMIDRITAYRWIKRVMNQADIHGPQACPKGLRHGYGMHAIRCGIQLNMLQKWMGHASIKTTAIYTNAVGREEQEIAGKMWK